MGGAERPTFNPGKHESREVSDANMAWLDDLLDGIVDKFEMLSKFLESIFGAKSSPGRTKDGKFIERSRAVLGDELSELMDYDASLPNKLESKVRYGLPLVESKFGPGTEWGKTLDEACDSYGVSRDTASAIMFFESGLNPTIVNPDPNSNATGLGQFIGSTWESFCKDHNARFKDSPELQFDPVKDRLNPKAQIWATVWYCRKNADALGIEDPKDPRQSIYIYIAHHDGADRAKKILRYIESGGKEKFKIEKTYWKKMKGGIFIDSHADYVRFVVGQRAAGVRVLAMQLAKKNGVDMDYRMEMDPLEEMRMNLEQEASKMILNEVQEAAPKAMDRMRAAGLDLDTDKFKNMSFSSEDIHTYQAKSAKLREELLKEEPRLKPFADMFTQLKPSLLNALGDIDLSKVKSKQDLVKAAIPVIKRVEADMDSAGFDHIDGMDLFQNMDIECAVTFLYLCVGELAMLGADKLKGQKDHVKFIADIMEQEGMFTKKEVVSTVLLEEVKLDVQQLPSNWEELVERGAISSGKLSFEHGGRPVELDLDSKTLKVGNKAAHFELIMGAEVKEVRPLASGGVSLKAEALLGTREEELSAEELGSFIDQVASARSGQKIDLKGAGYLVVE